MTIEQRGELDFHGVSKEHGTRILTISDHLEWTDYEYHSMALQDKINDYLEYIYSNRLNAEISGAGGKSIRIQLIMKHEPTIEAAALLKKIEERIERLGFEFVHRVFNQEQKPDTSPR